MSFNELQWAKLQWASMSFNKQIMFCAREETWFIIIYVQNASIQFEAHWSLSKHSDENRVGENRAKCTLENIAKKEKLKMCDNLEDTLQFLKDNPSIMNCYTQTYTTAQLMTKIDHDKLSSLEE